MNQTRTYIGAALIGLAGILFWLLAMPLYDNVSAEHDALSQRSGIIQNRAAIIANISALTKQYTARAADIDRFTSIVPVTKSAPELISSLQALASQNGLQLTTIALSGDVNQDNNPYQEQSIDLGMNGTYPAFKSFLIDLEKNVRVIDIISFDANPITDNANLIGFRIKGNAYYLK